MPTFVSLSGTYTKGDIGRSTRVPRGKEAATISQFQSVLEAPPVNIVVVDWGPLIEALGEVEEPVVVLLPHSNDPTTE